MKRIWLVLMAAAGIFAAGMWNLQSAEKTSAGEWGSDYDEALKLAAKEKKPVLINFTGSDWCGWCIRLDKEVFSQAEFRRYARKNLILLKIDFPQRKKLPRSQQKKNDALAQKFGVRGFPTVLLVNASGKVIGRTGYQKGGAKKYVKMLDKLSDKLLDE